MLEKLPELVNGDAALVRRGRHMSKRFLIEIGAEQYLVTVEEGRIGAVEAGPFVMRSWAFAIRASADIWERFWRKVPEPGYHDLFALLRKKQVVIEGDLQPFMANLLYLKLVLAAPRRLSGPA